MSAPRRPWRHRLNRQPLPVDAHPRTGQKPQDMTSGQLRARLVKDAVDGYETPILWAVAVYERISRLDAVSVDDAYLAVRLEVASEGAVMPGAPGQ